MTDGEIICAIDAWATRHAAPLVRVDSSNAELDGLAEWAVANAMLDIQRDRRWKNRFRLGLHTNQGAGSSGPKRYGLAYKVISFLLCELKGNAR